MELVAIKVGKKYVRFVGETFELCNMDKASVVPISKLAEIRTMLATVIPTAPDAVIVKLTITEEVLEGENHAA